MTDTALRYVLHPMYMGCGMYLGMCCCGDALGSVDVPVSVRLHVFVVYTRIRWYRYIDHLQDQYLMVSYHDTHRTWHVFCMPCLWCMGL